MRPRNIASELASDLSGVVRAIKDPGVYAARAAGAHVSRPIDVLTNVVGEGMHTLRQTPAGAERLSALLGDLDAARDLRFLGDRGASLGQAGAAVRGWAAGKGVLQIVDVGIVVDSVRQKEPS
ncbi:hypothetical protein [Cellulomonas sp. S1-8]|uniref:hypothetical protein n=1 Tax=Cellulomonas sp. S1-8 TaxID=2904790 RepID=UPI002243FA02|nr:hypothetical protein [Cellulomonas sp. S1-8]UZN02690.1 hypothetical protein OKX07_16780 [Cellulomonas sp. S1-8]